MKQAVYDAFAGTNQPTTLNGLSILVDEIGYQSNENGHAGYTGTESSPTVSEAQQATYYARVVQLYSCDPTISGVLFFHLIDETNLNTTATSGGWQSGLEYPDGTPKPSYSAVGSAISAGCGGAQTTWSPAGATAPTTTVHTKVPHRTSPPHHKARPKRRAIFQHRGRFHHEGGRRHGSHHEHGDD